MPQVLYLHWNKSEALATARSLRGHGFTVDYHSDATQLPRFRVIPDALVVSLERLPEQGRKVALWFHRARARAGVPVVFCGPTATHGAALRVIQGAHACTPRGLSGLLERVAGTPRKVKSDIAAAPADTAGGARSGRGAQPGAKQRAKPGAKQRGSARRGKRSS